MCRCGWTESSNTPHLCHRCGKREGASKLYCDTGPIKYSIAGDQPKVIARETIACDVCWEDFSKVMKRIALGASVPKEYDGSLTREEVDAKGMLK